jgi:hypothetical protein
LRAWPDDLGRIFDPKTLTASLLALIAWIVSTQTAVVLQRLDEPSELHVREQPAQDSLTRSFFWGGGVLLIVSGIARVGIAALFNLGRPPVRGLVLNVLVYYGLGLFMLGQVRYATLTKLWREQRTRIADGLARRWVRYSLVLMGVAGLLAFLLPTHYTLRLLDAISVAVAYVMMVINFVYLLIMFVLSLPLWLLSRLFTTSSGGALPPPPAPDLSRRTAEERLGGLSFPEMLRVLLFWALALSVVAYVVWNYMAQHPEIWRMLVSLAPIRALRALWRALWGRISQLQLGTRRSAGRREVEESVFQRARGGRRFWFGVGSARERVLYHYLGVLHRARRRGFPRHVDETPSEYGQALKPVVHETQTELEQLTSAFIEARYSLHAIEPAQGARARQWGREIRSALRGRKLKRPGGR